MAPLSFIFLREQPLAKLGRTTPTPSIRQHTAAYVSIRQHPPAYVPEQPLATREHDPDANARSVARIRVRAFGGRRVSVDALPRRGAYLGMQAEVEQEALSISQMLS